MCMLLHFSLFYKVFWMLTCHREADITKEQIEKVLKAGANVILTTKGIDDMTLKVRVTSFMMGFLWLNFKVTL